MKQYPQSVVQNIRKHLQEDGLINNVSDCETKITLLGVIFQKLSFDIAQKRGGTDWRDSFFVKKYLPRHKVDIKKIAGTIGRYITQYGSYSTQLLYEAFHELPCDKKLTFDEINYLFYKGIYISYNVTSGNFNKEISTSVTGNNNNQIEE